MNPSKSLMALVVALCLSLAPTAARAAADDWATISAGNQTFYLPQDNLASLEAAGAAPEPLYYAPDPRAKSEATLSSKITKTKKTGKTKITYSVNLLDSQNQQSYAVATDQPPFPTVKQLPPPPAGSPPQPPPAPQRPAGVDEGIWNVVLAQGKMDKDLQKKVALALQAHSDALPHDRRSEEAFGGGRKCGSTD